MHLPRFLARNGGEAILPDRIDGSLWGGELPPVQNASSWPVIWLSAADVADKPLTFDMVPDLRGVIRLLRGPLSPVNASAGAPRRTHRARAEPNARP